MSSKGSSKSINKEKPCEFLWHSGHSNCFCFIQLFTSVCHNEATKHGWILPKASSMRSSLLSWCFPHFIWVYVRTDMKLLTEGTILCNIVCHPHGMWQLILLFVSLLLTCISESANQHWLKNQKDDFVGDNDAVGIKKNQNVRPWAQTLAEDHSV